MYYRAVPGNLFWPVLVPAQVQATLSRCGPGAAGAVDCCVWVDGEDSAELLWQNGSFGKGILSRSNPTWNRRQSKEDEALVEPVQLSPFETLFLVDIRCLVVRDEQTCRQYAYMELWDLFDHGAFEQKYAAYYYYRSRGWVVRSGLKYGADFLLYGKGGPSAAHSAYAVVVRRAEEDGGLAASSPYMLALSRINTQARKKLILCYVRAPQNQRPPEMSQFAIHEFLVDRFNPNHR
ncbi:tRNA splicing endonuclease subunit sen2 [Coemansia sp. RSA 552]|nr:tRNA splicing endonuclease subunit sen2 [Coemansia sp. RSA 552]